MGAMPAAPAPHPSAGSTVATARWSVVLPVKGGAGAKSRLVHPKRVELSRAFALDAVHAVLGSPTVARVLVVTGDAQITAAHLALGADIVVDPGTGLQAALQAGAAAAAPDAPCALLLADLPALRAEDVDVALRACAEVLADAGVEQVTVPDADGDGTVLLAAWRPVLLRPAFGPGSAAAHARMALVLHDAPARLRRDVDEEQHLRQVMLLGVGPRTAAVLRSGPARRDAGPTAQVRSTIAPSEASLSPKRS